MTARNRVQAMFPAGSEPIARGCCQAGSETHYPDAMFQRRSRYRRYERKFRGLGVTIQQDIFLELRSLIR